MIYTLIKKSNLINMLDTLNEGVSIVDTTRKIILWNKAAENITGFTKTDVNNNFCYDDLLQEHVDDEGTRKCFSGCPLLATIKDGQKRFAKVYLHHKNGYRVAVILKTFPIINGTEIIGAFEIFSDSFHGKPMKENICELKTIAFKDCLIDIFNRRYMQIYLAHKIQEYENFKIPFGILFFDIDNFKNINDTYGHNIGDEILMMIAKTSQSTLRKTDILSRWGGEEFLILMPGIEYKELEKVAEKLRIIIQNSYILFKDKKISVTVSIGATIIKKNDTTESIVDRSDKLMYSSKLNGKNKVTISQSI